MARGDFSRRRCTIMLQRPDPGAGAPRHGDVGRGSEAESLKVEVMEEMCVRKLGRGAPRRRRGMVLAACVLASSMAFIDATALPVVLPRLRADFGADLVSVQWVLNGYMLALASLTLIGGALADVYGKARMLALGCVLFGLASAACALAPSPAWLIAARVAQGAADRKSVVQGT